MKPKNRLNKIMSTIVIYVIIMLMSQLVMAPGGEMSEATVQKLRETQQINIIGTTGLSYDDNTQKATHTSGDNIELSGNNLNVKSDSNGITLIVNNNFNWNNRPAGKYSIQVINGASIQMNGQKIESADENGATFEYDSSTNTISTDKGDAFMYNGVEVVILSEGITISNDGILLSGTQKIRYNSVTVGSQGSQVYVGNVPDTQGQGNYVYYNGESTVLHGEGFYVMEGNKAYIPTNTAGDNSETIIHDQYFNDDVTVGLNTQGDEAMRLQAFLRIQGYDDVGTIDSWAGSSSMAALKNFQRDQGLSQTGTLDAATRDRINQLAGSYVETENSVIMEYDSNREQFITSMRIQDGEFYPQANTMSNIIIETSEGMAAYTDDTYYEFSKYQRKGRTYMSLDKNVGFEDVQTVTRTPAENNAQIGNVDINDMTDEFSDSRYRDGRRNRLGQDVDPFFIVIHATAGGQPGADTWRNSDTGTSAHFLIDRDGTIHQLVDTDDTAHHVGGRANAYSIGIEFVAAETDSSTHTVEDFTSAQVTAGTALTQQLMQQNNIAANKVVPHEWVSWQVGGTSHVDPGAENIAQIWEGIGVEEFTAQDGQSILSELQQNGVTNLRQDSSWNNSREAANQALQGTK